MCRAFTHRDLERGIRAGLAEKAARILINLRGEVLRVLRVDEAAFDAHRGEDVAELRHGAACSIRRVPCKIRRLLLRRVLRRDLSRTHRGARNLALESRVLLHMAERTPYRFWAETKLSPFCAKLMILPSDTN